MGQTLGMAGLPQRCYFGADFDQVLDLKLRPNGSNPWNGGVAWQTSDERENVELKNNAP